MEHDFLLAIRNNPSDDGAWLDYADWLEHRGDPRGEVLRILLTVGLPSNLVYYPELDARLQELRQTVNAEWLDKVVSTKAILGGERPSATDIEILWQEIQLKPRPVLSEELKPVLSELLQAFQFCYVNGDALFGQFTLSPHPMLTWYGIQGRWADIQFFQRFTRFPAIPEGMCELSRRKLRNLGGDFDRAINEKSCQYGRASDLANDILEVLLAGGDHTSYSAGSYRMGGARPTDRRVDLHSITTRFCATLFGSRPEGFDFCRYSEGWAPWFFDVFYDRTWAIINKQDWSVSLLCATDVD